MLETYDVFLEYNTQDPAEADIRFVLSFKDSKKTLSFVVSLEEAQNLACAINRASEFHQSYLEHME